MCVCVCPPDRERAEEGARPAARLPRRLDGAGEQSWHRGKQLNLARFPASSELRLWAPAGRGATVSAVHLSSGFAARPPPAPPSSPTAASCPPPSRGGGSGPSGTKGVGVGEGAASTLDDAAGAGGTWAWRGACPPLPSGCSHPNLWEEERVLARGNGFLQRETIAGENGQCRGDGFLQQREQASPPLPTSRAPSHVTGLKAEPVEGPTSSGTTRPSG